MAAAQDAAPPLFYLDAASQPQGPLSRDALAGARASRAQACAAALRRARAELLLRACAQGCWRAVR
jgi:hypothetical protein